MPKKRRSRTERALDTLNEAAREGGTTARDAVAAALASTDAIVVARAAELAREQLPDGVTGALIDAFERFLADGPKTDPGCRAKVALLEAMDATEVRVHAPYLAGARHVQKEPAWGAPVDTAAGVRASSILALAGCGYPDLVILAGELLADPLPPVRRAALAALAAHGVRFGAGLARYKLRLGDEDPLVTSEAMAALLALAPDVGIETLGAILQGGDGTDRELALVALGESRRAEAIDPLLEHLGRAALLEEREVVYTALALHRSEPALRALLAIVRTGAAGDARAAVGALWVRRFEPDVVERVREAATESRTDLDDALDEAFGER